MKKYEEIHIWEFPPAKTFICLEETFRINLFNKLFNVFGTQQRLIKFINQKSIKYGIKRNYGTGHIYGWIKGKKFDRGKIKNINIPLWMLIEFSKLKGVASLNKIESKIEAYGCGGKCNQITEPKLPIILTPELVSVIFHLMGDGHIGKTGVCSSYRQMNKTGLMQFYTKLTNNFGNFKYSKAEFRDGRLNIPKTITNFYETYFELSDTDTFKAYLPKNIKSLSRDFLIAGLCAFIVDEGNICDVITIYSKNRKLIEDVREIGIKCGYICYEIKEKYAYGKFDCYRFNISSKSYKDMYADIKRISKSFPTCDLAQKMRRFIEKIH
ncbi:hypothetical protein JXB27_01825 [Candidatus Woesearchaeota archaeon]|nr:hypothetical protein [Candidatus Woesearchaeota archaeon]